MWTILVGLIERWWRDKPRKDVVRAVVRLRDTMIDCQSWYNQYLAALKANDIDSLSPNPYDAWFYSLDDLFAAVYELDRVLAIFSPEAHEAIVHYMYTEGGIRGEMGLKALSHCLGAPAFDVEKRERGLEESFSQALSELHKFISANFTPDEIFAATKGKLTRFDTSND